MPATKTQRTPTTPRYVLPAQGAQTFEFTVQAITRNKPAAFVSVAANTFLDALRAAVSWAEQFSTSQYVPVYAQVKYRGTRRSVKKISDGTVPSVYVESMTHAAWVPVLVLDI